MEFPPPLPSIPQPPPSEECDMKWLPDWVKRYLPYVALGAGLLAAGFVLALYLADDPTPPPVVAPGPTMDHANSIVEAHEAYIEREEALREEFAERLNDIEEEFYEVVTRDEMDARMDDILGIDRSCPVPTSRPTAAPTEVPGDNLRHPR